MVCGNQDLSAYFFTESIILLKHYLRYFSGNLLILKNITEIDYARRRIALICSMCYTCIMYDIQIYQEEGLVMLAIRLPDDIEKRLDILAKKTGRTKTYYVREAVIDHLEELEDIYLSLDRLEKPAKRWSLDDLEKEIDLDS